MDDEKNQKRLSIIDTITNLIAYLTICLSRNLWLSIYGSKSSKLVPKSTKVVNKHGNSVSSLADRCSDFGIKHTLSGCDFNFFNSY